jgi:hypothetical protein
MKRRLFVLLALGALAACKSDERPVQGDERPAAASARVAASNEAPPAPTAVGSAAPSAAASADPLAAVAGTWRGSYEAKIGSLTLEPKASPKRWGKTGETGSLGAGQVELTIALTGEVSGKVLGALGPGTLGGKAEDGAVRASLFPDAPSAPNAMTGVFVGLHKGDVIKAELRAAGPDATVVREATVELRRE